jgi:hypothetical protein
MKTRSITAILAALAITAGPTFAQSGDIGRCGQPRGNCGTCDRECDGSGYLNQGRGKGNGNGQGLRRGKRDGTGNGGGEQKRDRKRDGTGSGCRQGT